MEKYKYCYECGKYYETTFPHLTKDEVRICWECKAEFAEGPCSKGNDGNFEEIAKIRKDTIQLKDEVYKIWSAVEKMSNQLVEITELMKKVVK